MDDNNKEINQKKALAISIIILIGSAATVNVNIANGGPKAKKAQPKKSITVILIAINTKSLYVLVSVNRNSLKC